MSGVICHSQHNTAKRHCATNWETNEFSLTENHSLYSKFVVVPLYKTPNGMILENVPVESHVSRAWQSVGEGDFARLRTSGISELGTDFHRLRMRIFKFFWTLAIFELDADTCTALKCPRPK
jgi:hypothetical protein